MIIPMAMGRRRSHRCAVPRTRKIFLAKSRSRSIRTPKASGSGTRATVCGHVPRQRSRSRPTSRGHRASVAKSCSIFRPSTSRRASRGRHSPTVRSSFIACVMAGAWLESKTCSLNRNQSARFLRMDAGSFGAELRRNFLFSIYRMADAWRCLATAMTFPRFCFRRMASRS